jgi:hypothetical protein
MSGATARHFEAANQMENLLEKDEAGLIGICHRSRLLRDHDYNGSIGDFIGWCPQLPQ